MLKWTNKNYSEKEFIEAWNSSSSLTDLSMKLGYRRLGENSRTIKKYAEYLNLVQTPSFVSKKSKKVDINVLLSVDGPLINSFALKERLLREGVFKYSCLMCGLTDWLGEDISLELDHIDGNLNNNKIENLRILCPNCHAQTDTYCGKSLKKDCYKKSGYKLCLCGKISRAKSLNCEDCRRKSQREKDLKSCNEIDISMFKCNEKEFESIWEKSLTYKEMCQFLGLFYHSKNTKKIRLMGAKLNLSIPQKYSPKNQDENRYKYKESLEEIMVSDSKYPTNRLKKRMINAKIINNICQNCNIREWNGKPISLSLDHINGKNNDHRLENLRLLCVNCHSQTPTYKSKNRRPGANLKKTIWCNCGKYKGRSYKRCLECKPKNNTKKTIRNKNQPQILYSCSECAAQMKNKPKSSPPRCGNCYQQEFHIKWPEIEELKMMIKKSNYSKVSRDLGVSDNAVRKHIKRYG